MKKLMLLLLVFACVFCFGCGNADHADSSPALDFQSENALSEQTDSPSATSAADDGEKHESETYTIVHEKDGSTCTVIFSFDDDANYLIQILDDKSNVIQAFHYEEIRTSITLVDLNLDGYTDIMARTGITIWQGWADLYVWDADSMNFQKVIWEGPYPLRELEIYDGYLINHVYDIGDGGYPYLCCVQKLAWNGNTLTKMSETKYTFEDSPDRY